MLIAALASLVLICLEIALGATMIVTASAAANRQIDAASQRRDVVPEIIGSSSVALGAWGVVATPCLTMLGVYKGSLDPGLAFLYALSMLDSALLLFGGWLQLSVSSIEERRKREWRILQLRLVGWALVLLPTGPFALFVGVYFAVGALSGATSRIQQESLLLILAIAMRTRVPLAEEVEALADSSRGRFRRRLRGLAERLRHGERLSEALEHLPGLVPPQTVTAIRVGEELGNVVAVIQQEAARLRRREENRPQGRISATGLAFYLFCVLCVTNAIIGFLMFWIVPKFKKIFQDFGAEIPPTTNLLIQAANQCADYAPAVILALIGVFSGLVLMLVRRGGWAGLDWSVLSAVYPRMETPGVLRSLAQAVAVRRPLSAALAGLEVHHRRRHVRKRMRRVRDEVARGRDCFEPLVQYGLLNARESAALASAERAGNLSWALESVAESIERRQRAIAQSMAEMIQPTVVFALGFLVLFICVGFFVPLVHLIQVNVLQ